MLFEYFINRLYTWYQDTNHKDVFTDQSADDFDRNFKVKGQGQIFPKMVKKLNN